jgi:hypothetical protein
MFVSTLEALVLRGVSVLRDGQTVELRRGASAEAKSGAPEVAISMRHPSQGYPQANHPAGHPEVDDLVGDDARGAGRPRSLVGGVLRRRSPARIAGRAVLFGRPVGSRNTRDAKRLGTLRAKHAASGCAGAKRLNAVAPFAPFAGGFAPAAELATRWSAVGPTWHTPAGGTLPASTRGKGDR